MRGVAPARIVVVLILVMAAFAPAAEASERGVFRGYDPRPGLSTEGAWSWQDYPFWVPHSEPLEVKAVEGFRAENFQGPVHFSFRTPVGEFSRIILRVDVELVSAVEGRPAVQYDRPLWIWVDGVPAFIGTTTQRYNYVAFSDVTHLYPLLVGGREASLSIALPNWVIPDLGLTGVFVVDVTLLYYPGRKPEWVPDAVLPVLASSDGSPWPGLAAARLTSDRPSASEPFTLPDKVARAFLIVYLEGASYDEFWYASIPAPRLFVFKVDGQPIAIAPPYPQMYTGSLNPLLWRPLPGVRTLSFEPIVADVTGMLGVMSSGGRLEVEGIGVRDYWWVFAALALYFDERVSGYVQQRHSYEIPEVSGEGVGDGDTGAYTFTATYRLEGSTAITLLLEDGVPLRAEAESLMTVSLKGSHVFTEEASRIDLVVESSYSSRVSALLPGPATWSRASAMTTSIVYEFAVDPEGDPAEATPDNPVPATFRLYTIVAQSLRVEGVWPFTDTYRELYEASDAESLIEGELIFIGPTAAIITGITEAWGVNHKIVEGSEATATSLGAPGPQIFGFVRETVAGNRWPEWWVETDNIIVVWL
jgi:hypothetical protein